MQEILKHYQPELKKLTHTKRSLQTNFSTNKELDTNRDDVYLSDEFNNSILNHILTGKPKETEKEKQRIRRIKFKRT